VKKKEAEPPAFVRIRLVKLIAVTGFISSKAPRAAA
jgi:hypothetical protein